jgi:hypothetical protein
MKIPTLNPTTRKNEYMQRKFDTALAKPEEKRGRMDRSYIAQYGPQLTERDEKANPTVLVREYTDTGKMRTDIAMLLGQGWHIESQSAVTPKKGALRMLAGGFIFLNRKPVTTVVFSRPAPAQR